MIVTVRRVKVISATRFGLAAVFLASGAGKLAGSQFATDSFARWGYPDWSRLLVGALEVAGAIGLAVRVTASMAAGGLALLMAGAAVTHLRTPGEAALALVPVVLAAVLVAVASAARGRAG